MPRFFIRSTIFNLFFYALTGISCIVLLPTLILPRSAFLCVVHSYVHTVSFLEKYILGLTYEIRGQENLPKEGSYIVAAKHQSAYETLKLHILFDDPAVVLKKELLKIPLWGLYLEKSDVIAIDRSSPKVAIKSMQDGAKHVASQGRPIVVFPQGTRVAPEVTAKEKPYKIGIVRIQEATNLPIIPMALNTGVFHPRNAWCKKPGRIVFEFMKPISPSKDASNIVHQIEMKTEEKTSHLMEEGRKTIPTPSNRIRTFAILIVLLLGGYAINWFVSANLAKNAVVDLLTNLKKDHVITEFQIQEPEISGFPGKIVLSLPTQILKTANEELEIGFIKAQSWPAFGMPIDIETGTITVTRSHWYQSLFFNTFNAQIIFKNDILSVVHASLSTYSAEARIAGHIDFNTRPYPMLDLDISLENAREALSVMVRKGAIDSKKAMITAMTLKTLEKDGIVKSTITSDKNKIYLGPIRVFKYPPINAASALENGQNSAYSTKRIKPD